MKASSSYSYFPGCSLASSAIEYDLSFRLVTDAFGIAFDELEDWTCCGASPAPHHWGGELGILLPSRNLHMAARDHSSIVAPCAGCFNRLKYAQHELERNQQLRDRVSDVLREPVRYEVEVLNLVDMLNREISPEALAEKAQGRLEGIRLAPYYGCVLTRPAEIVQFDNPDDPVLMEPLLKAAGAAIPYFPFKSECCGSYMGLARKEIVFRASRQIIETAIEAGADALVTVCPLCHQNLDLRQRQINYAWGTDFELPVLYFSQAIGLALGASPGELGIDSHAVSAEKILSKMKKTSAI